MINNVNLTLDTYNMLKEAYDELVEIKLNKESEEKELFSMIYDKEIQPLEKEIEDFNKFLNLSLSKLDEIRKLSKLETIKEIYEFYKINLKYEI